MNLYIKNMVCNRCKLAIENELKQLNLHPSKIELGEVVLEEDTLTAIQHKQLLQNLEAIGFELLDDKRKKIIERIKTFIVELIHYRKHQQIKTSVT